MTKWNAAFPDKLKEVIKETDEMITPKLAEIDEQVLDNQNKVLEAFRKEVLMKAVC